MKKQKSVLMAVAKYPATFGHTSVINYLCKELNELGYRAAIGAFSFDSNPPFNIEKIKLDKRKLLTSGVASLDFDIIHPHQARVLYYLLSVKPNKPIVFHYHGASNKIQETNFKLAMWRYKKRISKFISVSHAGISQMKKLTKNISAEVIYNGVDTKIFNTEISTPYKKGSPQLLFVSGLRKYKKTKILIESMPKVLKEFPDAHLQIVGDGEDLTTLQDMISRKKLNHKIDLIGKINHDELKFYYSSCDLYISASTFEVCPIPTIEAMACGKPLVLFDIEPHAEIIRTSNAGKLFSSPDDIVLAIDDVFHNREYFGNLATKFGQELDWSIIAKQVSGIYDSL
jgi:glycosyltransferase involved in cell wall biosynthesis